MWEGQCANGLVLPSTTTTTLEAVVRSRRHHRHRGRHRTPLRRRRLTTTTERRRRFDDPLEWKPLDFFCLLRRRRRRRRRRCPTEAPPLEPPPLSAISPLVTGCSLTEEEEGAPSPTLSSNCQFSSKNKIIQFHTGAEGAVSHLAV
ncbi:hypothetical protein L596_000925 [Steinernema carpocapsae]|uniref:Uncharacterized protein n=1 Tax=Steinernema carpocapsae TaxID=34508 RepID=A0A4U8UKA2_STECR|nr:hypothetical protein L596_000925 [Steinernema carpocapsae]